MIEKMSNHWAEWLVQNGGSPDDKEIYAYGAECTISEVLSDAILLLCALFLAKTAEMALWLLIFTPLRIHIGGFHASNHFNCIFLSTVIGIFCVVASPYLEKAPAVTVLLLFISGVAAYFVTPVVHPNHPIPAYKFKKIRKTTFFLFFITMGILLALFFFHFSSYAFAGASGVISACLLGALGSFANTSRGKNK